MKSWIKNGTRILDVYVDLFKSILFQSWMTETTVEIVYPLSPTLFIEQLRLGYALISIDLNFIKKLSCRKRLVGMNKILSITKSLESMYWDMYNFMCLTRLAA